MVKYTVTIDLHPASSTGLHESFPYIPHHHTLNPLLSYPYAVAPFQILCFDILTRYKGGGGYVRSR